MDGIADVTRYKLTESAKRTLLAEMKINEAEEKFADMLDASKLGEKQLFFPKDIERPGCPHAGFEIRFQRRTDREHRTALRH